MIIVMKPGAPRKDTRTVIEKIRELGYTPHTIYGKTRNVIGAIGDERGKFVLHSLESLPGVERVVPILKPYKLASREGKPEPPATQAPPRRGAGRPDPKAVQAGQPGGKTRAHRDPARPRRERRGKKAPRHRRPVLRGERTADGRDGERGEGGRSPCAARGGVQAPDFPLRVPGARGTEAEDPAQGRGQGGDPRRDRGDEPDGRRPGRPVLRHPASGSPQRPELLPPEADRKIEAADPPQAGDDDDHHRVPHERRILPRRGKPPGDPLRGRDPHVRGRDPEDARPLGGRPGGRGRGRADDRGPPHPGEGPFRRPPVADLREIRGADGGLEALRRRGRQDDLSKPSRLAHMTSFFRPRNLAAALAGLFLLHLSYLYVKVGDGLARDAWEVPSILYGRPAIIRPGDLVDNLKLPERLGRLSYRKVPGKPDRPGTWSEEGGRIRIHTRGYREGDASRPAVPAVIGLGGRGGAPA